MTAHRTMGAALLVVSALACGGESAEGDEPMEATIYTADGVAIDGYDPVAYFTSDEAVRGSEEFSQEWRGANWHFATADNLAKFRAEPQRYAPQFGGHCAFAVGFGKLVPGSPTAWSVVDDKLYLNANGFAKLLWKILPGRIESGNERWQQAESK